MPLEAGLVVSLDICEEFPSCASTKDYHMQK